MRQHQERLGGYVAGLSNTILAIEQRMQDGATRLNDWEKTLNRQQRREQLLIKMAVSSNWNEAYTGVDGGEVMCPPAPTPNCH